jgi:bifunctional non-homologous end joining protein LigD
VGDHARVGLESYRRKRDPSRTPEPFGDGAPGDSPIFVVQRHAARRLHYDFRLERDGVLASWALPKGVPLEAGERHLAVHVEDHPLGYAGFEGEIPAGQYGAGTVEIWDRGSYELLEEKQDGGLTVRLRGERLQGTWTLVPAHLDGDPKNWLLLRKDVPQAVAAGSYGAMLATATEALPLGEGWMFEPKWDGFRALAFVRSGAVTLRSRNDNDLTTRFPAAARALGQAVRSSSAVVDGEICALDESGRPVFGLLQQGQGALVFVAFDLLERDGEPLLDRAYAERRRALEALLDTSVDGVLLSPAFDDGAALERAAREHGLEGVVAKKVDAPYRPGRRSLDWRKLKLKQRQELVIAGFTHGKGRRASGIGALVLGVHDAEGLRYAGNVGTGLDDRELDRLETLLRPLRREDPPFAEAPKPLRTADVTWVEPSLVAEIEFAEWTREGRLRAPVYVGLRDDKPAQDVVAERVPMPSEIRQGRRVLKLSNLDKLFWPDEGISKGDLLAFYRDVAPVLVPHLRGRPFTMKRYPDGWRGKHFFQKDAPGHMPDWIRRAPFAASSRSGDVRLIDYPLVNDELSLLWMVNMGCIDLNAWASRVDRPDRPDWIVFDLDPSADVGFPEVIEAALLVKQLLDLAGLESYPKTSGSRGIHVLVPIARRQGYEATRSFAAVVGGALERTHPGLVTTEWTKRKRRGVLVDANQNGPGKTTASVYSVRPRPGAPVSTPLRWEEVREGLDPDAFTFDEVRARVARHGDLFAPVLGLRQSLAAALKALGG